MGPKKRSVLLLDFKLMSFTSKDKPAAYPVLAYPVVFIVHVGSIQEIMRILFVV